LALAGGTGDGRGVLAAEGGGEEGRSPKWHSENLPLWWQIGDGGGGGKAAFWLLGYDAEAKEEKKGGGCDLVSQSSFFGIPKWSSTWNAGGGGEKEEEEEEALHGSSVLLVLCGRMEARSSFALKAKAAKAKAAHWLIGGGEISWKCQRTSFDR
jgi:hypothetical protein